MLAESDDIKYLTELAGESKKTRLVTTEAGHFLIKPQDLEIVDLAQFQHAKPPAEKKGTVTTLDVASFAAYFNRFKSESSMIFGEPSALTFRGIIDYHGAADGPADRCQHRVAMTLQVTERWKTWRDNNRKSKPQAEFAQFIDDNLSDIFRPENSTTMPSAADMLEVSRDLTAKVGVQFNQAIRLENGETQFSYVETIDGRVGKGNIQVPTEFLIKLPLYLNQPEVEIRGRLRYRIGSGGLTMWYELFRIDELLHEEFEKALAQVSDSTSTAVLLGTA